MKKTLALAAVVLMAGSLTACGGGDDSSSSGGGYCDQVKAQIGNFKDFDISSLNDDTYTKFEDAVDSIKDAAPDDIADDWSTMGDALRQLQSILDKAGISMSDLQAAASSGTPPPNIDPAAQAQLLQDLTAFSKDTNIQDAETAIRTEVQKECDVDINATDDSTSGTN